MPLGIEVERLVERTPRGFVEKRHRDSKVIEMSLNADLFPPFVLEDDRSLANECVTSPLLEFGNGYAQSLPPAIPPRL